MPADVHQRMSLFPDLERTWDKILKIRMVSIVPERPASAGVYHNSQSAKFILLQNMTAKRTCSAEINQSKKPVVLQTCA